MPRTILSLLLLTSLALASCKDDSTELRSALGEQLTLSVGVNSSTASRAMVIGTQLTEGSSIGVRVTDGGADYQGTDYSHVRFTSAGSGEAQKWTAEPPVYLSGQAATIYAYSPYQSTEGFEMTAIPVDMTKTDQTDWLYATPITGPCDSNPKADITLNHALTAFTLSFHKEGYPGAGEVTAVKIQSPALATGGTLDATTGTFTEVTGQGDALTRTAVFTLGDAVTQESTVQVMTIPTALKAALNITVTVDGKDYTAATSSMNFIAGHNYALTMKLTAKDLGLSEVEIIDWQTEDLGEDELQPVSCWDGVSFIDPLYVPTGVYAVAPNGMLVADIDNINGCAASDCIAVAVVDNEAPVPLSFWIEKYGEANMASITRAYTEAGINKEPEGWFRYSSVSPYAQDMTDNRNYNIYPGIPEWNSFSFFDGIKDTKGLIECNKNFPITNPDYPMAGIYCSIFNDTPSENLGYKNWFIPADGNLHAVAVYINEINEILEKIGGTVLYGTYFGSTPVSPEHEEDYIRLFTVFDEYCDFDFGFVDSSLGKIRLIRNFQLNCLSKNGIYYSTDGKTVLGNDGTISGDVIIEDGVTYIAEDAFYGCTEISGVTLPSTLTTIGQSAFYGCEGLTGELVIPEGVTTIADNAFRDCTGLTSVTLPGTLQAIGFGAFYGCSGLTEVTILEGVTSIGSLAFGGCENLAEITLLATIAPTIGKYTFEEVKEGGTLIVPQGCTEAYSSWMSTSKYYLGYYSWTIQEQ